MQTCLAKQYWFRFQTLGTVHRMAGSQVVKKKALDCYLQGCWFKSYHAIGNYLSFLGVYPKHE